MISALITLQDINILRGNYKFDVIKVTFRDIISETKYKKKISGDNLFKEKKSSKEKSKSNFLNIRETE